MTVENTRTRRAERRMTPTANRQYRLLLTISFFVLISTGLFLATFMNPHFMNRQVQKESNVAVINRSINDRFNNFMRYLGEDEPDELNLLNNKQTVPIAIKVNEYVLGVHGFKTSSVDLANDIKNVLLDEINDDSSTETNKIKRTIKKQHRTAQYVIDSGFNLHSFLVLANIVTALWIISIVFIVVALIVLISTFKKLKLYLEVREVTHDLFSSLMWMGLLMVGFYGILAILPTFLDLEQLFGEQVGILLEISTSTFLEFLILGVVFFVIAIIPRTITQPK